MRPHCLKLFACLLPVLQAAGAEYSIRKPVFDSTLAIHATDGTAGAIDSIKFRGREFVNSHDRGRAWQSSVSYDGLGECLSAAESGPSRSGSLLDARTRETTLETTSRMAFWLAPNEPYKGACGTHKDVHAAQNTSLLSDDTLLKQVTIGSGNLANVIDYLVTMNVGEPHESAAFEPVTGHMPPEFSTLFTFDPATARIAPLSDGPGEQPLPLIIATKDRRFAVGLYSSDTQIAFGRVRLPDAVKWDCASRRMPVQAGPYLFHCYIAIGTVEEVRQALQELARSSR
jgi:hypothetical protein